LDQYLREREKREREKRAREKREREGEGEVDDVLVLFHLQK
jgi:hypothetical protein